MRARRTKVLFPSTRTCGMLTKAGFWLLYGGSLIFGLCTGLNRTWDFEQNFKLGGISCYTVTF